MTIAKVIMFAILISVSNQQKWRTEETEHCGQYGFRCVDMDSFQICTYPDLDGNTDAPEIVHKCFDNNKCDEDNPAYCTPLDPVEPEIKIKSNEKCQKPKIFAKRSQPRGLSSKADPLEDNLIEVKESEKSLSNNRFTDKLDRRDAVDLSNEDEIETTTTETNEDYQFVNYQKFECEDYGYYPDLDNASMFWLCDHKPKGKGFIVRHMLCSKGRIFSSTHKECILIGTTRKIRNEVGRDYGTLLKQQDNFKEKRKLKNSLAELSFHYKFSCRNRLPGKYPDEINCRIYHYCLPVRFAP